MEIAVKNRYPTKIDIYSRFGASRSLKGRTRAATVTDVAAIAANRTQRVQKLFFISINAPAPKLSNPGSFFALECPSAFLPYARGGLPSSDRVLKSRYLAVQNKGREKENKRGFERTSSGQKETQRIPNFTCLHF